MCDNSITSADIYSEDFYELATVKELQIILVEYKEVFQEEINKLILNNRGGSRGLHLSLIHI